MHIGHLASNEAADQYVFRFPDRARTEEDGVPLWMRPPAAANRLAGDRLSQARNRPAPRFQRNAVRLYEAKSLLWRHLSPLEVITAIYPSAPRTTILSSPALLSSIKPVLSTRSGVVCKTGGGRPSPTSQ